MEHNSNIVKRRRPRSAPAVVEAAARLFGERGYVATTVESIAAEAGVAVQTVYNVFGSKSAVLRAVVEAALADPGGRSPRQAVREQALATGTGRDMLRVAIAFWVGVRGRSEPVFAVVRQAAAVDPDVRELERRLDETRLQSMRVAAGDLSARGWLRDGLGEEEAAAILWTLSHPAAYRLLVPDGRWGEARYARWLEDALTAALLRDPG